MIHWSIFVGVVALVALVWNLRRWPDHGCPQSAATVVVVEPGGGLVLLVVILFWFGGAG